MQLHPDSHLRNPRMRGVFADFDALAYNADEKPATACGHALFRGGP
jgi:hypothetical protein